MCAGDDKKKGREEEKGVDGWEESRGGQKGREQRDKKGRQ